ncbi:MAG: glycerol kinase, partial [Anaerolineae bacterium]|nr:glycerol kinase [Anaerolineae bacterium]
GTVKNTYSSGSFMILNTGDHYLPPADGLFSPVLWTIGTSVIYGLEGKANMAGDAIRWLQEGLGLVQELGEAEGLASQVPNTRDVYFVPPPSGADIFRTDSFTRGAILGIRRGITKHHIARAAIESVAYQVRDYFETIKKQELGFMPKILRADGRTAKSDFLLQFQADILGIPVERPVYTNTAVLGAGYLAGLATGYWESVDEIVACWRREYCFEPRISEEQREELYHGWQIAVEQVKCSQKNVK